MHCLLPNITGLYYVSDRDIFKIRNIQKKHWLHNAGNVKHGLLWLFVLYFRCITQKKHYIFSQKGSGISFEHGVLKVKKCILHPITSQRQTRMVCLDNVRLENLCLKMLIHACVWLIRKTLRMVFLNCILMMEEFVLHDLRPWYIFRTSSIVLFY